MRALDFPVGSQSRRPASDTRARRSRDSHAGGEGGQHHLEALLPLAVLAGGAVAAGPLLPDWAHMWLIAVAVFFGCKWMTWRYAPEALRYQSPARSLAYLTLRPGMDANRFLGSGQAVSRPDATDVAFALLKTALGAVLLWAAVPALAMARTDVAAWTGMVGVVFLLHFGVFHMLALAWQRYGVDAQPIMHLPAAARNLGEFWGDRWNLAYHHLASRYVYRPLRRRLSSREAVLGTFLISGLIHELVITVPAAGGYGLPTLYFVIQAGGMLLERSKLGARVGLARGVTGRLWTAVVTVTPLPLLFPPAFLRNVVIPFLTEIGAWA